MSRRSIPAAARPPLATQHAVPFSLPAWRRPSATARPVDDKRLFDRARVPSDFVRVMKLNKPFLVANGINPEAVAELESVDLQVMYTTLMRGGGFLSVNRLPQTMVAGGIVQFVDDAVYGIESELADLELGEDSKLELQPLWWDTLHGEDALRILNDKVATQAAATASIAAGNSTTFAFVFFTKHIQNWMTGWHSKGMRRRTVVGQTERKWQESRGDEDSPRSNVDNHLNDTDWCTHAPAADPTDPRTWFINGQAIAVEILLSLLAARVGVHVPIACCGSDRHKTRFWVLQCDYERTLDEMMSPTWCLLHSQQINQSASLQPDGVNANGIGDADVQEMVLQHAIRMVRVLSRMGILVLRLDPRLNIGASVSSTSPLEAVVALTEMRADHCQLVDLGDEFCQWYMECFLCVALTGPLRGGLLPFASDPTNPLFEKSLDFLYKVFGSTPGFPNFDRTIQTDALRWELERLWREDNLNMPMRSPVGGAPKDNPDEPPVVSPWEDPSPQTFKGADKQYDVFVNLLTDLMVDGGSGAREEASKRARVLLSKGGVVPPENLISAPALLSAVAGAVPGSIEAGSTPPEVNLSLANVLQTVRDAGQARAGGPRPAADESLPRITTAAEALLHVRSESQHTTFSDVAPQAHGSALDYLGDVLKRGWKRDLPDDVKSRGLAANTDADGGADEAAYGNFPGIYFRAPGYRHGLATGVGQASDLDPDDASSEDEDGPDNQWKGGTQQGSERPRERTALSADSKRFAQTMHWCVLDLAANFAWYWHNVGYIAGNRNLQAIVRATAGSKGTAADWAPERINDALDLLHHMVEMTLKFSDAKLKGPKAVALTQPHTKI